MLQLSQIKTVLERITIDGKLPRDMCHEYYEASKEIKEDIAKVFGDEYPDYLNVNRPREKKDQKTYRSKIYRNTFKGFRDKQIGRLDYIPESDDFSVVWPQGKQAKKLMEFDKGNFNEKLNFQDWFFDFVKTEFVDDPNSVLVFVPETIPASDSEPYLPKAELIPCENVLQFRKGKYCVLRSMKEVMVKNIETGKMENNGLLLYFFDHESFTVVKETSRASRDRALKSTFEIWGLSREYAVDSTELLIFQPFMHHCKGMPARKIGMKRLKQNGKGEELFASTVTNALEHIKDAQARYSDIQVEFNYHVNSQEYRVATRVCQHQECNKGKVPVRNKQHEIIGHDTCPNCQGTGFDIGGSALDFILYSMPKKEGFTDNASGSVPPVPGGFIPRPIESVRELVAEYKRKTEEAYADVHMQFHNRTPLVESGKSKEVDREEFYKDSIVLAKHLCTMFQWGYKTQAAYLYGLMGYDEQQLPVVMTPSRFMLSGLEDTRTELNEALQNKYDSIVTGIIQARYLEYQTGKDSKDYKRFKTRMELDPYREMQTTEKVFQFGLASQVAVMGSESHKALVKQFIFSLQFNSLLDEAELLYPDFYNRSLQDRRLILMQLNEKYTADIPSSMGIPMVLDTPVDIKNAEQV